MSRTQIAPNKAGKSTAPGQAAPTQKETLADPDFASVLNMDQATAPGVSSLVTPGNILSLQRSLGNQAVQRMIQRQRSGTTSASGTIQRDGTPVAARPGVGAYAMGKAPRVNAPAADQGPAKSPEEIQYDVTYAKVIGPSANNQIIEGLLTPSMQTVILPELSKSILVKTRKDLANDIKGDAPLYERLGPDDAAREAAL